MLHPEPPPTPGTGDVWQEIIDALPETDPLRPLAIERRQQGLVSYKTPLQRDNKRIHLKDALQEAMDLWAYLTAANLPNAALTARSMARYLLVQLGQPAGSDPVLFGAINAELDLRIARCMLQAMGSMATALWARLEVDRPRRTYPIMRVLIEEAGAPPTVVILPFVLPNDITDTTKAREHLAGLYFGGKP